ncbi:hypothetical protein KAJ27_13620, partial [bacterium]|nr:hypothetical protein [bacterium]
KGKGKGKKGDKINSTKTGSKKLNQGNSKNPKKKDPAKANKDNKKNPRDIKSNPLSKVDQNIKEVNSAKNGTTTMQKSDDNNDTVQLKTKISDISVDYKPVGESKIKKGKIPKKYYTVLKKYFNYKD